MSSDNPRRPTSGNTAMFHGCTLTYFDGLGRGEVLRLALNHLGIAWTDDRIKGSDWPALKAAAPWGKLPFVKLSDGTHLAQTKAILRLVGKQGGLYPADALAAFRVDELVDTMEDLSNAVRLTGDGKEQAEKEAIRTESSERGEIHALLRKIDDFIGAHGSGGFAVGASLSIVDFAVFSTCSSIASGVYDGVPPTVLNPFARLQAVRKTVASLPSTIAWYEHRGDAKSKGEIFNAAAKDL